MAHPQQVLISASDYLDYDVDMLLATGKWLHSNPRGDLISNAVLESFLIHARTLIEFLSREGRGNAVRAPDFFDGEPEGSYVPDVSPFLQTTKDRISTHLAHLTTEPLHDLRSTIGWDVKRIILDLWAALTPFYEAVPSHTVLPDYPDRYARFKERAAFWTPSQPQPGDQEAVSADSDFIP